MSRWAGTFLLLGVALLAQPAAGDTYPERPIRLISPNPAGGANDTIVRIIAARMSMLLGQTVVVDNRGGAGGKIGAEAVARAAPDGYTLLAGSVSTHSFAPVVSSKLSYHPIADFEPISLLAMVQNLLVVNPKLPAKSLGELIALAKASPGKLNYASGGPGSTSHFAVAMFNAVAGIQDVTVHVPFRGGGPAMTATIAGDTQYFFSPIAGMVPFVESGQVRALAVSGDQALARPARRLDHSRSRHAALQGGRLVRPDGAGQDAASDRGEAQRHRRRRRDRTRGDRGVARPGHRADCQPSGGVRHIRPRAA